MGLSCTVGDAGESEMDEGLDQPADEVAAKVAEAIDVAIDSPAIRRLIEEVRAEEFEMPAGYNRTFNRHNR